MKIIYEWIKHTLWLIGWIIICIIKLDKESAIDTFFWLKIHLNCKFSVRFDLKRELSLNQQIENFFVRLIGYLFLLCIAMLINIWLVHLVTYIKLLLK